jgi:hypothetical protein
LASNWDLCLFLQISLYRFRLLRLEIQFASNHWNIP